MIQSGDLIHRVEIQAQTLDQDDFGDPVDNGWATETTRWANVKPLAGRELVHAQQQKADTTHQVTLRYEAGLISREKRLIYKSRTLHILSDIHVDERHHTLVLLCKEVEVTS